MENHLEDSPPGNLTMNRGFGLDQSLGFRRPRRPGEQSPAEGSSLPQQGLLLGEAGTTLALLGPTAEGQRQQTGVTAIELTHQPLGSSHEGILIAAPARLAHLIEVALKGHGLEGEAAEQQEHGNPQGKGEHEAALRRRREQGFAGNEGSHGSGL
jgi:hypothetical protein